jgi:excisionase family DNA binding protein
LSPSQKKPPEGGAERRKTMIPDRFITSKEVAKSLGVSVTTVYKLIREGKFPQPMRKFGMSRWSELGVQAWMTERVKETYGDPASPDAGGGLGGE